MPATSKQSLIVTGKTSRGRASPRAMRTSESLAARQVEAASRSRSQPDQGARWRSRAENSRLSSPARKLEAESSKSGMAGSPGML
jgi:hypothetical protein